MIGNFIIQLGEIKKIKIKKSKGIKKKSPPISIYVHSIQIIRYTCMPHQSRVKDLHIQREINICIIWKTFIFTSIRRQDAFSRLGRVCLVNELGAHSYVHYLEEEI